jgi:hypothetical protein
MSTTEEITYRSTSAYDDVWSKNVELCAFCAQEIAYNQNRCPRCGRNLIAKYYRYAQPSSNLHILWVLLTGLGLIFLGRVVFDLLVERNVAPAVLYTILAFVLFGLAAGVYLRYFWAYLAAVFLLLAILFISLVTLFMPINLAALGLGAFDPAISNVAEPLVGGMGEILRQAQLVTVILALFYAIFKAMPDFEQVRLRRIAVVSKGLTVAGDYHLAAKRLAQAGMWASAVLNWQRAAAREPHQVIYQRYLGQAYAELGFYERSLDVLQSAHNLSTNAETQGELQHFMATVRQKSTAGQHKGKPLTS